MAPIRHDGDVTHYAEVRFIGFVEAAVAFVLATISAVAIAVYVGSALSRRVGALTQKMQSLAEGDLSTEVPQRNGAQSLAARS